MILTIYVFQGTYYSQQSIDDAANAALQLYSEGQTEGT
jgi:hypothetical protein